MIWYVWDTGGVVYRCVQNICDTVYMGLCGVCVWSVVFVSCVSM